MEVVAYCQDHSKNYKEGTADLGVPLWDFYRSKSRIRREERLLPAENDKFIQLGDGGSIVPDNLTAMEGKGRSKYGPKASGEINIECRTVRGGLLRMSGTITAETLAVLVQNL